MNVQDGIDPETFRAASREADALLKALSNRHRLLIVCELLNGKKSVGQLAQALGVRSSTASQHLALLRREGIIGGERDGHTVWYRITSKPAVEMMKSLYASCCATSATRKAGKKK
ncbi:MAG: winged helix-turn-helix transcriptional regulator [Xanthobacteraceae bacterium]|nr:winged helix-turn-helix transcriptional regulator [Xanthobacteraceae bacterium]